VNVPTFAVSKQVASTNWLAWNSRTTVGRLYAALGVRYAEAAAAR
jgi:hypothetical protein